MDTTDGSAPAASHLLRRLGGELGGALEVAGAHEVLELLLCSLKRIHRTLLGIPEL